MIISAAYAECRHIRPPRAPWGSLDSGLNPEFGIRNPETFLPFLKAHLVLQGAPPGFCSTRVLPYPGFALPGFWSIGVLLYPGFFMIVSVSIEKENLCLCQMTFTHIAVHLYQYIL